MHNFEVNFGRFEKFHLFLQGLLQKKTIFAQKSANVATLRQYVTMIITPKLSGYC